MEGITFGVLGPVVAWDAAGGVLGLKGPRHRAVLARLITARRRVVPVAHLVEDLWDEPGPGAVGAVQTFVAALRRVLEPDRPARAPARLLVTEGPGYALRAAPDAVDAWRFEAAVGAAAKLSPAQALEQLQAALDMWRGPAYAEFVQENWARGERSRLAELRLQAVEQQAQARLALGLAAEAVPDLDAHLAEHPWREEAWRLLALALYRTGRQADALAVLRRARTILADELGLDPGPELRRLETDVLTQDARLDPPDEPATAAARLWTRAAAAYDRTVAAYPRARLEATVGLLRNLAVTGGGGLQSAQEHRLATITAAEELGDPELTARVIGAYDVPAIWTRNDNPQQAQQIVAAAERTLAALPRGGSHEAARCRLLATVALEMRGTRSARGPQAAGEAEEIARRLDDPTLLAFALNGAFMQSCTRAGLAPRRDAIGAELVALAVRHGLVTFEVLGHLIQVQARSALGDFRAADEHAAAAERLAERHERPLASVFTQWYRALRLAASGQTVQAEAAYRAASAQLDGAGMPGVEHGLLPLAQLCLRLAGGSTSAAAAAEHVDADADWGPYRPWAEVFVPLRTGRRAEARAILRALPEPPADLMYEAMCCLETAVALELGDRVALERLHTCLLPAAGELAGAGSGLITLGPVDGWLTAITDALD
ncbi:BTAD domain-containing putative transcriptional regulator [Streptomyces peucetius]|uniref:Winged helix-turn-helix domain-containing protein n=1 Tax=Streptomyces peucetius TaxID=1950 RepID=A0ABY6IH28_STRPE|nr:BTAD domain-containing putative transcriptional regulator [Streptomyces peucetius]UYQ66303.1 winged helix-turn-helix domain-containing protein [Streptomyces peucetius]